MFSLCWFFPWYAFPSFPLQRLLLGQGHPTITPTSWKFTHSPRLNCKCSHPWSHPWSSITMWGPWSSCACALDWRVLFFHLSVPPRQSRPSVCLGSPCLLQYFPRVKELSKHCSMDTRFIQRGSPGPKIHRKHSDLLKDYISSHTHTHTVILWADGHVNSLDFNDHNVFIYQSIEVHTLNTHIDNFYLSAIS